MFGHSGTYEFIHLVFDSFFLTDSSVISNSLFTSQAICIHILEENEIMPLGLEKLLI